MKKFFSERKLNIILSLAAVLLMWAAWLVSYYCVNNDYIVPSFKDTLVSFYGCLVSGEFYLALANTLWRTAIAFAISFFLALACATAGVAYRPFRSFFQPMVEVCRTVPTLAVILVLLLWTSPKVAPVAVTFLVLFPMIYSQLLTAFDGIDGGLIEMAKVYKISKRERFSKIYLPQVAPSVISLTGANLSLGIKIMISAEVLAHTYKSLGGLMLNAKFYLDVPRLMALTLIAVIVGLVIDLVFALVERHAFRWKEKESSC